MFSVVFVVMTVALGDAARKLQRTPVGSFVHASSLPGSTAASSSALKRARERGELVRVAKGVYWKGKRTRYGMALPPATDIAFEVLGTRGVGPTGFSAARWFGLTTQIPPKPALAVTGKSPKGLPVIVTYRANLQRASLTPAEIAALELLRGDWETTVDDGWPALSRALAVAITGRRLRWAKLVKAATGERSSALRSNMKRLSEDLTASGILA